MSNGEITLWEIGRRLDRLDDELKSEFQEIRTQLRSDFVRREYVDTRLAAMEETFKTFSGSVRWATRMALTSLFTVVGSLILLIIAALIN